MDDEMEYEFEDDYITIRESYNNIFLYEHNHCSEISVEQNNIDNVISLLENINGYFEEYGGDYVDLGTYEGEDEDGDPTGDYYWEDDLMDSNDINPYFSPEDNFYGNCIYRDNIPYILEALREYVDPSSIDRLDRLTLKSILRLKRSLANEN